MMNTLSFNVTHGERGQVVDATYDARDLLRAAGCDIDRHDYNQVSDDVCNVHIRFIATRALGPNVLEAIRAIRRLPMVDAVCTL